MLASGCVYVKSKFYGSQFSLGKIMQELLCIDSWDLSLNIKSKSLWPGKGLHVTEVFHVSYSSQNRTVFFEEYWIIHVSGLL